MNTGLIILCLAAFAIVAVLVSGAVGVVLASLDELAARLPPRHRARFWLGLAVLPSIVAVLAVAVSLLPAVGIGHDHCLAHGDHHLHLCPHHLGGGPGIVLTFVALLASGRFAHASFGLLNALRLSGNTSATLAQASERHADALVFPSEAPQAFVLGALRPRIHISSGLKALGPEVVDPVLAHERVHAARRDLLWRTVYPLLAIGHLPTLASALRARVCTAQEMAADAEAVETLPDGRLRLARVLVLLARACQTPAPGISFTHGDVEARVRTLLEERPPFSTWPGRVLVLSALVLPAALGASHDLVHHSLETLLGALS